MFITWTFLVFVIISFLIYWILPRQIRPYFLTAASAGYFALSYPREMLFLFLLALVVYLWGCGLRRLGRARSWFMAAGVVLLIGDLAFFKYAGFVIDTARLLASLRGISLRWQLPHYFVPLGISYFTFKMIHYLVDLKKGDIPQHRVIDFFSYIFFFPILISGPIERFQPFLKQSGDINRLRAADLYAGLPRIAIGLFKKVVLADTLALVATTIQQPDLSRGAYWIAALAYTFQIYFDFSGYSDMAIGIARLFGYRVMENFNYPYLSSNVSEFWKRWHMSLTGWFRDYLFIPLGGSRVGFARIILNTWIVMAVTGLWHGAAWHFVLWGMFHACGLTAMRLYRRYLLPGLESRFGLSSWPGLRWVNVFLTFNFVNIGWIFFACDARQALYVISRMFG